jgi:hypothetical protein
MLSRSTERELAELPREVQECFTKAFDELE